MNAKYLFLIFLNLSLLNFSISAQILVKIGIRNDLKNIKIKISEGDYALTNGNDSIILKKNDTIILENNYNKLSARTGIKNIKGDSILLISTSTNGIFSTIINNKLIEYEDNAIFYPKNNTSINFINQLDIDKYVASVILSETYPNLPY